MHARFCPGFGSTWIPFCGATLRQLLAVLQQGIASPEHAAFVAGLKAASDAPTCRKPIWIQTKWNDVESII